MNISKVFSIQGNMLSGSVVEVEVDILKGLRAFSIVGLGDKAVDEAKDRIASAIKNSGFKSPKNKSEKVVISLAPGDTKKNGTQFDTAMALGYLKAVKEIDFDRDKSCFFGELGLDGSVRPIHGILPLIRFAKEAGFTEAFVPKENAEEASLISGIDIYGTASLRQIIDFINTKSDCKTDRGAKRGVSDEPDIGVSTGNNHLLNHKNKSPKTLPLTKSPRTIWKYKKPKLLVDIADIRGQEHAKRGLLIAASGEHNIALYGPPGTGKTMLGKAFSGILPPLSKEDVFDVTSIHSVSGILETAVITHPPFRSPHHTASFTSIIGGGSNPRPGEITLAHKGVLFLDEISEFEKRTIDGLRQPLEDKSITISRVHGKQKFPSDFLLFATMNPCPCGYLGSKKKECICLPHSISHYKKKISGPIIDRIDMWIEVAEIPHEKILKSETEKRTENKVEDKGRFNDTEHVQSSICFDEREGIYKNTQDNPRGSDYFQNMVMKIRHTQSERFGEIKTNGKMSAKDIGKYIDLEPRVREILQKAGERLNLSVRSYHKVIKLARTIADIENSEEIKEEHVLEALQYRPRVGR